ncbi:MAG: hypothetical protein Q9227_005097 [Pyrenula ochraceoflavens]
MLKNLGHNVRILEQSTASIRNGHAAGIRIAKEAQEFFKKHDQIGLPISLPVPGLQFIDRDSKVKRFIKNPMENTSWSMLYYRLRANFDGYTNAQYCPDAPQPVKGQGTVTYDLGKRVTEVECTNGTVHVTFKDLITGNSSTIRPDLVIAADGSSSAVRSMVMASSREEEPRSPYAGYVAWRGTVPESEASEETRKIFNDMLTFYVMKKSYILCYVIPGQDGSLKPGRRLLNFVWYHNHPEDSQDFAEIMTDKDGHRHRSTLPEGKMDEKVWARQVSRAEGMVNAPFLELIQKTKSPFISTVRDAIAPKASYFNGKLLLVGDALALYRPHCALSANQAALDCLTLERAMNGEISIQQWEKQVLGYGTKIRALSAAMGGWFLMSGLSALGGILRYLAILLGQKMRIM